MAEKPTIYQTTPLGADILLPDLHSVIIMMNMQLRKQQNELNHPNLQ
jgi:hypothetical protein